MGVAGYMVGIGSDVVARLGHFAYFRQTVADFSRCFGTGYSVAYHITFFVDNTFYTSCRIYK